MKLKTLMTVLLIMSLLIVHAFVGIVWVGTPDLSGWHCRIYSAQSIQCQLKLAVPTE